MCYFAALTVLLESRLNHQGFCSQVLADNMAANSLRCIALLWALLSLMNVEDNTAVCSDGGGKQTMKWV